MFGFLKEISVLQQLIQGTTKILLETYEKNITFLCKMCFQKYLNAFKI